MAENTEALPQDVKLVLAQERFLYRTQAQSAEGRAKLQKQILEAIYAGDMAPTYEQVTQEFGWPVDPERLAAMKAANTKALSELEDRIKDAEENLGDVEVRDAWAAKAEYLCKIGDRAAAAEAFAVTEKKTAGVGQKMDLAFSLLRLDMVAQDWRAVKTGLQHAKELCNEGGDWERKNRLKVYEGTFCLATRDFKHAAHLFLDSIATFTATEVFSYETCILYTVLTSIVTLPRTELKKKVVDAPEILAVISSIPNLVPFLNSLYSCNYATFFKAFAAISDQVRSDLYMHPHLRYYMREVRMVAYSQFLESYKSVTLESMAAAFGVSPDFIDKELADFIVAGRLTAKIDKVAGVIETNRLDAKNAQYQQTIKQGDILLNRLQKLSKVIDVE